MKTLVSLNHPEFFKPVKTGLLTALALIMIIVSCNDNKKQVSTSTMAFTVTMENPNNHYYHVSFTYTGASSPTIDFKLPVWTPGYYMIMDYAKYLINFKASNGSGKYLECKKVTKNTWRVQTANADTVNISYDIFAFRTSVADSYLDDGRGFISPTGMFIHPAGKINHPVTVTVIPYKGFSKISTGLDPVAEKPNTYYASDFDVLYDCPILAGNQEILTFEVQDIPLTVAAENLGSIDRNKFIDDHKRMVESAISIIGEVPYKHYTFIIMNRGGGGLEHTNSMAVFSSPSSFDTPNGYKRWLGFVAHEFFHLYNVKDYQAYCARTI